jgi:propane monooxygenase small subunit
MLATDEQHGEDNEAVVAEWLAAWTSVSEAARRLQPIWSLPSEKAIRFERSSRRFRGLISDVGLGTPKEA